MRVPWPVININPTTFESVLTPRYISYFVKDMGKCPDIIFCVMFPELKKRWENYQIYLLLIEKSVKDKLCDYVVPWPFDSSDIFEYVYKNFPGLKVLWDEYQDCLMGVKNNGNHAEAGGEVI